MDLFHVKIFQKPKKIISLIYSVELNIRDSHFVKVEYYKDILYRPGINPLWLDEVLEIQKNDLVLARECALRRIEDDVALNKSFISVGFAWDVSEYKYDKFMSRVLRLVGFY